MRTLWPRTSSEFLLPIILMYSWLHLLPQAPATRLRNHAHQRTPKRLLRTCHSKLRLQAIFLGRAIYAGLGIPIWLPLYFGDLSLPTTFSPVDSHIHEMLYGYLPAVITGFLLPPFRIGPAAFRSKASRWPCCWRSGSPGVSPSVFPWS